MANSWGSAVYPVNSPYRVMTSPGVGPRNTNTSSRPLSENKWVWVVTGPLTPRASGLDRDLALTMSTQVSAPLSQSTPTVEPFLWACMNGIDPYRVIGLSSSYSNTSRLYSRYGSS